MGCRDRGFFCLERAASREKGRRSFVEDRVARGIVELSTMPVEGRIAVLWWGRGGRYLTLVEIQLPRTCDSKRKNPSKNRRICPVYYDKRMLNQVICLNKN